jgi:2-oxoglutarate dehydrogenase complex dehydrogenase (E1) component-like enzyme
MGEKAIVYNKAMRRAGFLAQLGWRRLERNETDEPATLQPLYLRRPAITKPRKGKR